MEAVTDLHSRIRSAWQLVQDIPNLRILQTVRINGLKLVFRLAKEVAIFLDAHAARIEILAKQRL